MALGQTSTVMTPIRMNKAAKKVIMVKIPISLYDCFSNLYNPARLPSSQVILDRGLHFSLLKLIRSHSLTVFTGSHGFRKGKMLEVQRCIRSRSRYCLTGAGFKNKFLNASGNFGSLSTAE